MEKLNFNQMEQVTGGDAGYWFCNGSFLAMSVGYGLAFGAVTAGAGIVASIAWGALGMYACYGVS